MRFVVLCALFVGWENSSIPQCLPSHQAIVSPPRISLRELSRLRLEHVNAEIDRLKRNYPARIEVKQFGAHRGHALQRIDVMAERAEGSPAPKKICITAGVHGHEPMGTIAALELVETLLSDPAAKIRFDITVMPMLNPAALESGTRRAPDAPDLNRSFLPDTKSLVALAVMKELGGKPFDLALDLHGANERPYFFAVGSRTDDGFLQKAFEAAVAPEQRLPSDNAIYPGIVGVRGVADRYQLSAPGVAVSLTPGTLKSWFAENGTPRAYTIEYGGLLPREQQLDGMQRLIAELLSATEAVP